MTQCESSRKIFCNFTEYCKKSANNKANNTNNK